MSKNYVIIATEEKQDVNSTCTVLESAYENDVIYPQGKENVAIVPRKVIKRNGCDLLLYEILNVRVKGKKHVFSCGMTGCSSTMDYLVFETDNLDFELGNLIPVFATEETKTTESESGNTSTYQRLLKSVYIRVFYPGIPCSYLYNTREDNVVEKGIPANVAHMIRVILGIGQTGKGINPLEEVKEVCDRFQAAKTPEEKLAAREEMLKALSATINSTTVGRNCIAYRLIFEDPEHPFTSNVKIQARLGKGVHVNICNDPSEGFVAGVVAALDILGNTGSVTFINHKLEREPLERQRTNKLLQILKVSNRDFFFEGIGKLDKSRIRLSKSYLREAYTGEKNASILVENMIDGGRSNGKSEDGTRQVVFDNHAGCSKSFFRTPNGDLLDTYKKQGIPDMVVVDWANKAIYYIEAEMSENVNGGIKQLETFKTWFKKDFVDKHYPGYKDFYGVITYGPSKFTEGVTSPNFWLNIDMDYNFDIRESMPEALLEIIKKNMPRTIDEEELSQFAA